MNEMNLVILRVGWQEDIHFSYVLWLQLFSGGSDSA